MDDPRARFRRLHEGPDPFVMPNPWDIGTARILARMGFPALATTSAGLAFSLGLPEGAVSKDQMLAHCRAMVGATPLPVTADLEKGFGDSPESSAETIRVAASIGLAGCSLEDHTGDRSRPIFDFSLAVERIQAAAEARATLSHDFILTARCENFLWGRVSIDDTIKRLQAFERAGADVLYAPGLRELSTIRTICQALSKPVNVVVGISGANFSVADLANAGVKRVSIGSALARLSFGAVVRAAREMQEHRIFDTLDQALEFGELESFFI